MSVGYGTHKGGRPLSPVEVGNLFQRALDAGASLEDCAKEVKFRGTTQVSRFLAVRRLPPSILHLVDWGHSSDSTIGFTTAVELARVQEDDGKASTSKPVLEHIANAILEHGLQTDEVRQIVQIRKRSGRPIEECVSEVIRMRPTIERRYVFIGAIQDENVRAAIGRLTQAERNSVLHSSLSAIGLKSVSGRLGERLFTLVGGDDLNRKLQAEGRETVETRLRAHIAENIGNVHREG
jgi:hypothetical protein